MAAIKPPYALVASPCCPISWRGSASPRCRPRSNLRRGGVRLRLCRAGPARLSALRRQHPAARPRRSTRRSANPSFLLAREPGVLLRFVLGVGARAASRRRDTGEPLVAIPALAALGALAAYLVQGKGWLYQAYPALAFMILAAGLALELRPPSPRASRSARSPASRPHSPCFGSTAGRCRSPLSPRRPARARSPAALEGRKAPRRSPKWASPPRSASPAACSPWTGSARRPSPARSSSLGPHPTVAAISESLAFGHPMVRRVGGVWVQSVPSLWIASAARRLIDERPGDAALAQRLRSLYRARPRQAGRGHRTKPPRRDPGRPDSTRAFTDGRGAIPRSPPRWRITNSSPPTPTRISRRNSTCART